GPDGNLWFTENIGKVGRLIPSSGGAATINDFSVPAGNSQPAEITTGPDGNLWFTESSGNQIGRIILSGLATPTINEFTVPTNNSSPAGITAGSDGNLWFTEYNGSKIGRRNFLNNGPVITAQPTNQAVIP